MDCCLHNAAVFWIHWDISSGHDSSLRHWFYFLVTTQGNEHTTLTIGINGEFSAYASEN